MKSSITISTSCRGFETSFLSMAAVLLTWVFIDIPRFLKERVGLGA